MDKKEIVKPIQKQILQIICKAEQKNFGTTNSDITVYVNKEFERVFKRSRYYEIAEVIKNDMLLKHRQNRSLFGLDHFSHICYTKTFDEVEKEFEHECQQFNEFVNRGARKIKK